MQIQIQIQNGKQVIAAEGEHKASRALRSGSHMIFLKANCHSQKE